MDTGKSMNWDWEKLQQQQKKRSGQQQRPGGGGNGGNGGMPPQMDDLINRFKGFNFSWLPIILIVLAIVVVY